MTNAATVLTECPRCVMNGTAGDFALAGEGGCNYCAPFLRGRPTAVSAAERAAGLARWIERIKTEGRGKPYDCVIGLSGGADSSYVLLKAKDLGLRPLAVHFDNGWNSELAVKNIENLVKKLGVDLHTDVVDWEEFRDLQRSFFKAHVVDIELLTDNAMLATNYLAARRHGVRTILGGTNNATEGLRMPAGWNHALKWDAVNIRDIQRRFGSRPIKTMPILGTWGYVYHRVVRRIAWVSLLDFMDYNKAACVEELVRRVGYRPYPYKHYESVFTRFYQGHILPRKFGVDKRRVHLSALVCNGQMDRAEAARLLAASPYPDPALEAADREFFLKKLGFTSEEFESYLAAPAVPHEFYATEEGRWRRLWRVGRWLRRANAGTPRP